MKLTTIALFLRKFFTKINNFIQWTKKWYFFHIMALCNIPLIFILAIELYYNDYSILFTYNNILNIAFFVVLWSLSTSIPIALIITIIIYIISRFLKKDFYVYNKFLSKNIFYNIYYILIHGLILVSVLIFWLERYLPNKN